MNKAKEGDVYGVINAFGKVFEIRYGYYEEYERHSRYNDPVPVYPDLASNPVYSDDGYPIVTQMQPVCEHYTGGKDTDRCGLCAHFEKGEALVGLCRREEIHKVE